MILGTQKVGGGPYDNGLALPPSPVAIGTPGEAQAQWFGQGPLKSTGPAVGPVDLSGSS